MGTAVPLVLLHSSFFIFLSWTLPAHFSFEMGWTWQVHFSFEMGFTLLSHCSFQIGLDSSDFSFLFQAQETQGVTRCTQLGSILRITTSYLILFSFPSLSIKQNRLVVDERNWWNSWSPAHRAPLNAMVCLSACGSRAGFGEPRPPPPTTPLQSLACSDEEVDVVGQARAEVLERGDLPAEQRSSTLACDRWISDDRVAALLPLAGLTPHSPGWSIRPQGCLFAKAAVERSWVRLRMQRRSFWLQLRFWNTTRGRLRRQIPDGPE